MNTQRRCGVVLVLVVATFASGCARAVILTPPDVAPCHTDADHGDDAGANAQLVTDPDAAADASAALDTRAGE